MSGKIKELEIEDLEKVTGGLRGRKNCPNFLQALNKQAINECNNCLYYNKVDGKYQCTRNNKDKNNSSFI